MKHISRILFITAFPPNRSTAGQNYTRNLLSDLSLDNEIDVLYWKYPDHVVERNSAVKTYQEQSIIPFFRRVRSWLFFPLFSRRFSSKTLKKLREISNKYDIIYFDFSQTFIYSLFIDHPMKIGMIHDVIFQKYQRLYLFKLLMPWIRYSEKKILSTFRMLFTFSDKDNKLIMNEYGLTSRMVPFYIEKEIQNIDLKRVSIEDFVVMYGAWNRAENQESLKWVISNYTEEFPELQIIGGGMPKYLQDEISKFENIKYLGFVDNPYVYIAKSKGLLAPLFHGAGVKVKAVEALALGTPILGTSVTFEGLPLCNSDILLDISEGLSFKSLISKLQDTDNKLKVHIREKFSKLYSQKSFKEQIKTII